MSITSSNSDLSAPCTIPPDTPTTTPTLTSSVPTDPHPQQQQQQQQDHYPLTDELLDLQSQFLSHFFQECLSHQTFSICNIPQLSRCGTGAGTGTGVDTGPPGLLPSFLFSNREILRIVRDIRIEHNGLRRIPEEVFEMRSAVSISLRGNKLGMENSLLSSSLQNQNQNEDESSTPLLLSESSSVVVGSIPVGSFSKLRRLEYCDLSRNFFSGSESSSVSGFREIFQLTQLKELNLDSNPGLRHLSSKIGDLNQLVRLGLGGCGLRRIPSSIGNLVLLEWVCLRDNSLTELPREVLNWRNIQAVLLERNRIRELPRGWEQKDSWGGTIQQLLLWGNRMTQIPCLKEVALLSEIRMGKNRISDGPEGLDEEEKEIEIVGEGGLKFVRLVDLSDNRLTACPRWLGRLGPTENYVMDETSVEGRGILALDLSRNRIVEFPESIHARLRSLKRLLLPHNRLSSFPLLDLPQLEELRLSHNLISGFVPPAAFLHLPELGMCFIDHNQIVRLPATIGLLTKMYHLKICYNELLTLPKEIVDCSALRFLNAGHNHIRTLPPASALSRFVLLRKLDLSHNNLTEPPSQVARILPLVHLDLRANPFLELFDDDVERARMVEQEALLTVDEFERKYDVDSKDKDAAHALRVERRTLADAMKDCSPHENLICAVQ